MSEQNKRKSYQTDLSDKEWQKVEPYIPKPKTKRGRKREHPLRELINAIFYVVRSGCAWRLLPHDFPPWKTVYHYFRLWRLEGIWERMNAALRTELSFLAFYGPNLGTNFVMGFITDVVII